MRDRRLTSFGEPGAAIRQRSSGNPEAKYKPPAMVPATSQVGRSFRVPPCSERPEFEVTEDANCNCGGDSRCESRWEPGFSSFSPLFEITLALVCLDHIAGRILLVLVDGNQNVGTVPVDANGNRVPFKPQAMLDESLKQQKRIAELEATVERQQKGMEVLMAQLKEQAAQIQKVSAQLELSKSAPQTVLNNQHERLRSKTATGERD
jgi:uncharacterized coiled-coil protein SlyX